MKAINITNTKDLETIISNTLDNNYTSHRMRNSDPQILCVSNYRIPISTKTRNHLKSQNLLLKYDVETYPTLNEVVTYQLVNRKRFYVVQITQCLIIIAISAYLVHRLNIGSPIAYIILVAICAVLATLMTIEV